MGWIARFCLPDIRVSDIGQAGCRASLRVMRLSDIGQVECQGSVPVGVTRGPPPHGSSYGVREAGGIADAGVGSGGRSSGSSSRSGTSSKIQPTSIRFGE
jgi:hypothetical protein